MEMRRWPNASSSVGRGAAILSKVEHGKKSEFRDEGMRGRWARDMRRWSAFGSTVGGVRVSVGSSKGERKRDGHEENILRDGWVGAGKRGRWSREMVRFSPQLEILPPRDHGPKLKSPSSSGVSPMPAADLRRPLDPFDDCNAPSASFDLDTLDCSVCMEPLSSPIFQCCNGHYACLGCTMKMNNKCPTCSEPTGKIRNLGLEKIIESLRLRCKFCHNGCAEILTHVMKKNHEQRCLFVVHNCPVENCDFYGPLKYFSLHFTELHNALTLEFQYDAVFTVSLSLGDPYVLLQAEGKVFLLHNCKTTLGNVVYVTSFCNNMLEEFHRYILEVKSGKSRLSMASVAQSHKECKAESNATNFLVIPRQFFAIEGQFQVEVSICQAGESASPLHF